MKTDSRSSVTQRWRECLHGSLRLIHISNLHQPKKNDAVGDNLTTIEIGAFTRPNEPSAHCQSQLGQESERQQNRPDNRES